MRFRPLVLLLLVLASPSLRAEFLRVEVTFQDTGCASCIASLEGRLSRVRGMERVEIDAERGVATMHLAPGNRARLTPLLSRITQDGTEILGTKVEGLGAIERDGNGLTFIPTNLNQGYRLEWQGGAGKKTPEPGGIYRIRGSATGVEPGAEPVISVASLDAEAK